MSPSCWFNNSLVVFKSSSLLLLSLSLQLHQLLATTATRYNAGGLAAALHDEGERCSRSAELWPCLTKGGAKVVAAMAAYPGEIPLMGQYLTVVPDGRARTAGDFRDEGRAAANKNGTSSSSSWPSTSVYSKIAEFMEKRSLRLSVPMDAVAWLIGVTTSAPVAREEGRKKDKGAGVLMLGGMMMITTLMSTAFGALALMAAKGLLTSILALMLSAMAVSKKSGGHGHARTTYEVINNPGPHQAYQHVSDYKLENGAAVVSDINAGQYNAAQTEPIQYGNQQYD
ncbi:unnamed protein product [Macrosiphum euphorbiae]|uniref:Uncharacterized protein n=1 Tax=Macrosiphum euphorbiae TaxID=13131 RepID=A0AAV0XJF8_9HEMI|nr:unnamed protein product [Macrosiphum euphorbiae]